MPQDQRKVAESPQCGLEGGAGLTAGSAWHLFKASPSFLLFLGCPPASLLQGKEASYLGLSLAN